MYICRQRDGAVGLSFKNWAFEMVCIRACACRTKRKTFVLLRKPVVEDRTPSRPPYIFQTRAACLEHLHRGRIQIQFQHGVEEIASQ